MRLRIVMIRSGFGWRRRFADEYAAIASSKGEVRTGQAHCAARSMDF